MTKYFLNRVQKLQKFLGNMAGGIGGNKNIAILLTKPTDITYFTNFSQIVPEEREAYFLCTVNKSWIFHHSFSPPPAIFDSLLPIPKAYLPEIVGVLSDLKETKKLLIDDSDLTHKEFTYLSDNLDLKIETIDRKKLWRFRQIKDKLEVELMTKAGEIVKTALKKVINSNLKPGVTELELAAKLDFEVKSLGAKTMAFPTIVAFGENGALPHHQPTNKKLEKEMPVLIDVGARYQDYRSDVTRSLWFGKKPNNEFKNVEKIVKKAYKLGITELENRLPTAKKLDKIVRNYIVQEGYGKNFIHTTGHGLGLDIHEPPSIAWNNDPKLKIGMTITVEPGIYLDGKCGYRHENTVYLSEKGVKVLT